MAAQDLLQPNSKISDVAMRYQYDTQESFSKAFKRFHGVSPSKIKREQIKLFYPLTVNVTIKGGFEMSLDFINEFHFANWNNLNTQQTEESSAAEKYKRIVQWAVEARGQNPVIFDKLTEWILDDSEWGVDKLAENEQILMQGVFTRFREQNAKIRAYLKEPESSGVVNEAVFKALDIFDDELSGRLSSGSKPDEGLQSLVMKIFTDFTVMRESSVRKQIAGNKTGIHGTDSVDVFGYINYLKGSDAQVQWCLFMPDLVKQQQEGFNVKCFEYKKMPAMRFIGMEYFFDAENSESWNETLKKVESALTFMQEYKSDFNYDVILTHHFGKGVDAERNHDFIGRFMKADTPVPDGFVHWDFVPDDRDTPYLTFRSQFAFVIFSGDINAMHNGDGYDVNGMYDVTRNIILGQGIQIPYPEIYWTAEVFLDGFDKPSTAFMFSVIID